MYNKVVERFAGEKCMYDQYNNVYAIRTYCVSWLCVLRPVNI